MIHPTWNLRSERDLDQIRDRKRFSGYSIIVSNVALRAILSPRELGTSNILLNRFHALGYVVHAAW